MDTTQSAPQPKYSAPVDGAYIDWRDARIEGYEPTERQQLVVNAVESALKASNFSHDAVTTHCAQWFGLAPHQIQQSEFALDCYLARGFLEAQARHVAERRAWELLKPSQGQHLGTLVFKDGKRTTEVEVVKVEAAARHVHVTGMHGRVRVELRCQASAIERAMDLAKDHGLRRTSFGAFTQPPARSTRRASAPTAAVPAPAPAT